MASLHMGSRALLLQPAMQAYLAEEGKRIDYLAARIPEYKAHQTEN